MNENNKTELVGVEAPIDSINDFEEISFREGKFADLNDDLPSGLDVKLTQQTLIRDYRKSTKMEKYFNFIRKIMNKIHVCHFSQLQCCLIKKFKFDNKGAGGVIFEAQKENILYISIDGYVMTPGYYIEIADDKFFDKNFDRSVYKYFIQEEIFYRINREDIYNMECFTVIAQMMPASEDFFLTDSVWRLSFVPTEEMIAKGLPPVLYQIVRIPRGANAISACYSLERNERIDNDKIQRYIKRIAVIGSSADVQYIPSGIGIGKVVMTTSKRVDIIKEDDYPWQS